MNTLNSFMEIHNTLIMDTHIYNSIRNMLWITDIHNWVMGPLVYISELWVSVIKLWIHNLIMGIHICIMAPNGWRCIIMNYP